MNEVTLFLAKMMAAYLFATGLGFFLSKRFYLRMLHDALSAHPISVNLSGMVHFFIGMAVVLNHFLWGHHLEIVVSLLGLAFLLKGSMLIVIPDLVMRSNKTTARALPFAGTGFIALSIYLAWASYLG